MTFAKPMTEFCTPDGPNLVVTGTEAYAEDSWHRLRIGEVEFEVVKPCSRCVLTTVNVEHWIFPLLSTILLIRPGLSPALS